MTMNQGGDETQPSMLELFELVAELGDKHLQEMRGLRGEIERNTDAVEELQKSTLRTNDLLERLMRGMGRR